MSHPFKKRMNQAFLEGLAKGSALGAVFGGIGCAIVCLVRRGKWYELILFLCIAIVGAFVHDRLKEHDH